MSAGIVFSANDAVLSWTLPFLTSLRAHNPDIPLALIPFDADCEGVLDLAGRFGFTVFEDESFGRLEAIGARLELGHSSYGPHWFRRYAAFWGPFERFAYLDARQVILGDLTAFVEATATFGIDLAYYDTELDQVYAPGPMRTRFLREGGARGFNSGRWASRRGLFTVDDFETLVEAQMTVRSELNPRNTDQAFINHACDAHGVRMVKISDLLGDTVSSGWARQKGRPYRDEEGVWRLWDHGGNDHRKRLLLMHWAGYQAGDLLPNGRLLRHFGGRLPVRWSRLARNCLATNRTMRRLAGRPE
ncbi:hypothetical protein [Acuticoccus sp. I52.16.1]|uniref:hypothetical protein n=1 Tax=Acuticoccus sp. I52.16.1 TaxID=2928472 RepID=UPI001FD4E88B|nr:hypothetical protein [Acuticoccus sp. I52.16.1]UOM36759.1 hypothetical protein MRB58_11485 [Acuticoccus sp. I52.16.1]